MANGQTGGILLPNIQTPNFARVLGTAETVRQNRAAEAMRERSFGLQERGVNIQEQRAANEAKQFDALEAERIRKTRIDAYTHFGKAARAVKENDFPSLDSSLKNIEDLYPNFKTTGDRLRRDNPNGVTREQLDQFISSAGIERDKLISISPGGQLRDPYTGEVKGPTAPFKPELDKAPKLTPMENEKGQWTYHQYDSGTNEWIDTGKKAKAPDKSSDFEKGFQERRDKTLSRSEFKNKEWEPKAGKEKEPTPVNWKNAADYVDRDFGKQDAMGNIIVTTELAGMRRIAREKLVNIQKEGNVKPLEAVNIAVKTARDIERGYFILKTKNLKDKKKIAEINNQFRKKYGYTPSITPRDFNPQDYAD